jgi:tRNA G18 (ribose-2'-O)-methylase SpoU
VTRPTPFIPVDDLDDPRIAVYRNVKATNLTRDLDLFVLEGEKLLDRLLASPRYPIASALATDRRAAAIAPKLPPGVPLHVVPHERIADLVGYHFHLGVLSAGRRVADPPVDDLLAPSLAAGRPITLAVCPGLQNPENLGAVARIADVFGADGVLVGPDAPDPLSRRVLRVSMGTVLRLPTLVVPDLAAAIDQLRARHGFGVLASVTDPDATPLDHVARPLRLALLLGNEARGLPPDWIARADARVTIPMRPGAESLNLAVAAGILLHRLTKTAESRPLDTNIHLS